MYVNRVGEEDGLVFCGGSLALDPDAVVLAEAAPGDLLREELYVQRVSGH